MWTDLHPPLRITNGGVRVESGARLRVLHLRRWCKALASRCRFSMVGRAFDGSSPRDSSARFLELCHVEMERSRVWIELALCFQATCRRVAHRRAFHLTHTRPAVLRQRSLPGRRVPSESSFGGSTSRCTLPNLLESKRPWSPSLSFGVGFEDGLQFHVGPPFLRIMSQLLISRHREHHSRRLAIMGEHTWPAMLLQLRSVFARVTRKIGETDDVLIKNQIHKRILAQNNVRSQTTMLLS